MTQLDLDLGDITIQPDLFDTNVTTDTGDVTIFSDYSSNYTYTDSITMSSASTITVSSSIFDDGFDDGTDDNFKHIQEQLDAINERLAILQPNPEHLEKYDALREAYEHYKTLERLIKNG